MADAFDGRSPATEVESAGAGSLGVAGRQPSARALSLRRGVVNCC